MPRIFERYEGDGVCFLLREKSLQVPIEGVGDYEQGGALLFLGEPLPPSLDIDTEAARDIAVLSGTSSSV